MTAVILAGGLGTRMGKLCEQIPKPMTLICGKPVLQHQIEALHKEGITEFIFVVGHLSQKIEDFFGDGSSFGVKISYYREAEPLGTAGALFRLNLNEDFLLCNGDLIFDFNLNDMIIFHKQKNALATIFAHPNNHPYDSTLIQAEDDGRVTKFISSKNKPFSYPNLCNAGIQIISPELLKLYSPAGKVNLDNDILKPAVKTTRIFAYKSSEYVHDMGTPERLRHVSEDVSNGTVKAKHRGKLQKAVFLDRDGTVNVLKGFITTPEDMELIPGAAEAIIRFNQAGYLVIIITNQPIIARGDCTTEKLTEIHNRLETLLGEKGAFLDGIYYCPHHPDKGFENEVKELKIECNCRKPAPGLLLQAQKDFNIDLSFCYMVGDTVRDVEAAKNAGCTPVLLTETNEKPTSDNLLCFESLSDFSLYFENQLKSAD